MKQGCLGILSTVIQAVVEQVVSAYDSSEMCGSRLLRASNFENSPQESDILGQMSNLIKQMVVR